MHYKTILEYARELRKKQTSAEKFFWEKVRNRRFLNLKFNRQFVIEHESRSYFIADFHCFEKKLIIEIDGDIHRFQPEYDKIREETLIQMGYKILRFQNQEILQNWESVERRLVNELSPNPSLEREGNQRGELKRIAIIGPESTGKSEMAQQLAAHYKTEWVPEYARFYLDRLNHPYEEEDLLEIAKGQVAWEDDKAEYAKTYLFCDTNLIVIKIWSEHRYGNTHAWIEQELTRRSYDFYLLGNIDLIWTPDPQREHPKKRKYFFDLYEQYLVDHDLSYATVSGFEGARKQSAISAIEEWETKR